MQCAEPRSWAAAKYTETRRRAGAWRERGARWAPLLGVLAGSPPGRQLKEIQQRTVLLMGVQRVVLTGPEFCLCHFWAVTPSLSLLNFCLCDSGSWMTSTEVP